MTPANTPSARRLVVRRYRAATALYVVSGVTAVLCLALATWGWRSARRLEAQERRAALEQAEQLAQSLAQEIFQAGNLSQNLVFGRFLTRPAAFDVRSMRELKGEFAGAAACKCGGFIIATGGFFYWTSRAPLRLETLELRHPDVGALRSRAQTIAESIDGPAAWITMRTDDAGNEILAPIVVRRRGAVSEVLGYLSTPQAYADSILVPTVRRVTRARYADATDALLAWRLVSSGGLVVGEAGTFAAGSPFVVGPVLRLPFAADTGAIVGATLADALAGRAPSPRLDPRETPYRLLLQVHPDSYGAWMGGGGRQSNLALFLLLGAALSMTAGTAILARRLVAHMREREAFTTAMAHDLRTPLTQILLFGESMQLDRPAVRAREDAARVIVRETRRLIHMVENALAFARGDRARPTLAIVPMDLGTVVDETLDALRLVHERASVRVNARVARGLVVDADRTALAQILTNLIENAVRFGPDAQTLDVTLVAEGAMAVLRVHDEGPGVPDHVRTEIFRPFVRAGPSPGAGIGLAVSRQLAELMGGTLTLEASAGGATFALALPLVAGGT